MTIRRTREDFRFYKIWGDMKNRCSSATCKKYYLYGGRGIKVTESWKQYENFKADMWESYVDHCNTYGVKNTTLDRINPDGNYEPENCRWATYKEQRVNVRNKEVYKATNLETGETYIFNNCTDFCKEHGFTRSSVIECVGNRRKAHKGWSFQKILDNKN